MDKDLSMLSNEEVQQLKDAHAYITILISGADGKIDKREIVGAEKIVKIRSYAGDERLHGFHEEVNQEFHEKVEQLIAELPTEVKQRSAVISEKLTLLNPILASLDPAIGSYLYKSYLSFAKRVAKSAGGILSFFAIGPEEKKWMALTMLTAIAYNPYEEEE
jgi:hypothetical protein